MLHLDALSARDIGLQVEKVLADLGKPDPPLQLDDVRALLRLDLAYYSKSDAGALQRFMHSLHVAGKQIAKRPGFLVDFVRRFRLDGVSLLDQKKILLNSEIPIAKQRWNEAHEIGHHIIPWHANANLGDDTQTLTPGCHEIIEMEANQAARRLLFLGGRFEQECLSLPSTLKTVQVMAKRYGNTLASTLYAFVEGSTGVVFGAIGPHPLALESGQDAADGCRHFMRSPRFAREYPHVTPPDLIRRIRGYCRLRKWRLGEAEEVFTNGRGEQFVFRMETIFNSYDALTLGVQLRPHAAVGIVSGAVAG